VLPVIVTREALRSSMAGRRIRSIWLSVAEPSSGSGTLTGSNPTRLASTEPLFSQIPYPLYWLYFWRLQLRDLLAPFVLIGYDPMPDSVENILRLAMVSGIGPRTRKLLLERFGSSSAVLQAAPSELREVPGVGPKLCQRIAFAEKEINVAEELEFCHQHDIGILTDDHPNYPRMLSEIHDPPAALFVRGAIQSADMMAVAIVGTRHSTNYGNRQAERLAAGLARAGVTIVSGLARGIDAAAHRGALSAGGRTLAVLAGGVMRVYPPEHEALAADIARRGALLSETPPRFPPKSGMFPQRNRIISGLSLGVIVVEAADRSGALITATHANEQGREVFAVPGPVDLRTSHGCHQLIRDGAKLVEGVDDVLNELGPLIQPTPNQSGKAIHSPAELQLNDQERAILDAIESQPTSLDQVSLKSGLPIQRVLATVSVLEMRRLIRRVSGSLVART